MSEASYICHVCTRLFYSHSKGFYCGKDCEFADTGDVMTAYDEDCAAYLEARGTVATFIEDLRDRVPVTNADAAREADLPWPPKPAFPTANGAGP